MRDDRILTRGGIPVLPGDAADLEAVLGPPTAVLHRGGAIFDEPEASVFQPSRAIPPPTIAGPAGEAGVARGTDDDAPTGRARATRGSCRTSSGRCSGDPHRDRLAAVSAENPRPAPGPSLPRTPSG